jgi:DNA-binding beta-propeller fold protein YncE
MTRRLRALLGLALATSVLASAASAEAARTVRWIAPGGVAVSPDGRNLYATGIRTLTFRRDADSGELEQIDSFAPPGSSIAITPDGRWVFVGYERYGANGGIHILSRDADSGLLTHRSTFGGVDTRVALGRLNALAVSPDGRHLYASQRSEDAVVAMAIDPQEGSLDVEQVLYGGPGGEPNLSTPFDLAISGDGRNLYVAADTLLAFAREPLTGRLTQLPPAQSETWQPQAWRVAVAPDGGRVYAGLVNYGVYDRDAATGALTMRSRAEFASSDCWFCSQPGALSVSPDSTSILAVQSVNNRLLEAVATPEGAALVQSHDALSDGVGMAWSPDGRFAYVAGGEDLTPEYVSNPSSGGTIATFSRRAGALEPVSSVRPEQERREDGATTGVSVNDGAIYTNVPNVRIKVSLPPWTPSSFRLANDGGFGESRLTRVTGMADSYEWTLDASGGPQRTVKHVYVRFTGNGDSEDATYSDDVILDQLAPRILAARLKRVGARSRLLLRARDNRSGVRKVQVTTNRRRPGRARRFTRRVRVAGAPRAVLVRVIDGAGNRSRWRRARG